ncbi:MAG: hypothetical protein MUO35_04855, partial [Anaerolineales bacterium]|nr:hypothetical protein [Anaerolineales bacterium]
MPTPTRLIPYRQDGEPPRQAAVVRVEPSLEGMSDDDVQVLGHLIEAADRMNPIFRHQSEARTASLQRLVLELIEAAEGPTRQVLEDYRAILELQNGPHSSIPAKNHLLDLPAEDLRRLAQFAGARTERDLQSHLDLLTRGVTPLDKANLYPEDLTDVEFEALGNDRLRVNSSVVRDPTGAPHVVLNETRYRSALLPVLEHLRAARDQVSDPGFRLYLDAKISELESGSEEARRVADHAWVSHTYPIDIVISTALEVYIDGYRAARGAATGAVHVRNRATDALLQAIVAQVPRLESTAPWTHRKTEVDPSRLPKLKFVDVVTWAGDYVGSPMTTLAQSLPNDEWIAQKFGAVNVVYVNSSQLVLRHSGRLAPERFLTRAAAGRPLETLFTAYTMHTALHEIGHSTGRMDPQHVQGQPRDYLQEEYSWLEEARAELFGPWALRPLVEAGVLEAPMEQAGFDGMLLTLLGGLKHEPQQAHISARNAIFHYFEELGGIRRLTEGGQLCFEIPLEPARRAAADLLRTIADLRSAGDKQGVARLRQRYVYTDDLKPEIEARTADLPLGTGLVFPRLRQAGGRYVREWIYPERFEDQPKFAYALLSEA